MSFSGIRKVIQRSPFEYLHGVSNSEAFEADQQIIPVSSKLLCIPAVLGIPRVLPQNSFDVVNFGLHDVYCTLLS